MEHPSEFDVRIGQMRMIETKVASVGFARRRAPGSCQRPDVAVVDSIPTTTTIEAGRAVLARDQPGAEAGGAGCGWTHAHSTMNRRLGDLVRSEMDIAIRNEVVAKVL